MSILARILLVEDSPDHVELFRRNLADLWTPTAFQASPQLEHEKTLARTIQRLAENGGFDLVVLDLGLPDCTGLDTFKAVRKTSDPHLPVVIFSAAGDERDVIDALKLGAQDYIFKGDVLNAVAWLRAFTYADRHAQLRGNGGVRNGSDKREAWDTYRIAGRLEAEIPRMAAKQLQIEGTQTKIEDTLAEHGRRFDAQDRDIEAIRGRIVRNTKRLRNVQSTTDRIETLTGHVRWLLAVGAGLAVVAGAVANYAKVASTILGMWRSVP